MGRSLVAGKLADAVSLINTEMAQEKADARRCVHACSVARFARVVGQHWGGGGQTHVVRYVVPIYNLTCRAPIFGNTPTTAGASRNVFSEPEAKV